MAAFRNGIKTVIIPADNGKDLEEIDQTVRKALQFVLVERAEQVLEQALLLSVSNQKCGVGGEDVAVESETTVLSAPESRNTARLRQ